MKQMMTTSADGKEEQLYLVPPRNKLFLQENSTSPSHATCYATTDMDNILAAHDDIKNPKIHDSLSDSFTNQPVFCLAKKRGQIRRLLIGFGINYVVNTAIHYRKI